ncbi:MAG: hypothetical protein AABZ31_13985 [Bdellovibrionota bacterium]
MPDFKPRQFASADEIIEIGLGLLDKTLPKAKWTHEAHFAALIFLFVHKPKMNLKKEMPKLIFDYNIASGGANTDTTGYHETLTQFYITIVGQYLLKVPDWDILTAVNHFVTTEKARREYPLYFYSKEILFSVKARREWVAPDKQAISID